MDTEKFLLLLFDLKPFRVRCFFVVWFLGCHDAENSRKTKKKMNSQGTRTRQGEGCAPRGSSTQVPRHCSELDSGKGVKKKVNSGGRGKASVRLYAPLHGDFFEEARRDVKQPEVKKKVICYWVSYPSLTLYRFFGQISNFRIIQHIFFLIRKRRQKGSLPFVHLIPNLC